jgi:hypothetical protein
MMITITAIPKAIFVVLFILFSSLSKVPLRKVYRYAP